MKIRLQEWYYWNISRKTSRFIPWVVKHLPKKVKYAVVIEGMVKAEPNGAPTAVTGMQMLDIYKEKVDARR